MFLHSYVLYVSRFERQMYFMIIGVVFLTIIFLMVYALRKVSGDKKKTPESNRMKVHMKHIEQDDYNNNYYFVIFERTEWDRYEFSVPLEEYDHYNVGDEGMVTYLNGELISFEKQ